MSDYFLSKVYDSLIKRKLPQAKSTFCTLSESYTKIYEQEEQEEPQKIKDILLNVDEYSFGSWSPEQKRLYLLTASNKETKTTPDIPVGNNETKPVPTEYDPEIAPGSKTTGVGPGEYAVASLISGLTDQNECSKLISGQSESFDVSWPDANKPKYKFEVKKVDKLDDVRIGAKGVEIGFETMNRITHILNTIKDEYSILNKEDKNKINQTIIKQFKTLKVPGEKTKARTTYDTKIQEYSEWELDKYIDAILNRIGELPFGMLFDEIYSYKKTKDPLRTKYIKISLYKLLQTIEQSSSIEGGEDKTKEETESESEVKNVFHKVYGGEEVPKFKQFLDKEAHKVDRKITKQKIDITKEGGTDYNTFVKAIKRFDLFDELKKLKEKLTDKETVKSIFPDSLDGLFIVDIAGYKYIPRTKIGDYILINNNSAKTKNILSRRKKYTKI